MFNNPFLKKDPLVEAVRQAQQDGDMRRIAESMTNELFEVYSRKAVVREYLNDYDFALEEAYKCMKEAEKMADKDYDGDGDVETAKKEVWGSRLRAAKASGKYKGPVDEEQIDEISHGLALRAMKKSEKRSDQEFNRDQTYDRLSDYQTHDERAERLRGHMRKKFGNDKPGRGETGGDRLKDRRMSDRLTHGKRAGMPSARHKNDLKSSIKYSLGTHKKANLPEETLDEISKELVKRYKKKADKQSDSDYKMTTGMGASNMTPVEREKRLERRERGAELARKKMDEAKGTAAVQNMKHRDFKETRHPNPGAVTKAPVPGVSIAEDQVDEGTMTGIKVKSTGSEKTKKGTPIHSADVSYKSPRMKKAEKLGSIDTYHRGRWGTSDEPGLGSKEAAIDALRSGAAAKRWKARHKQQNEETLDEAAYSAKAARAGKDIAKRGKQFAKIAKSAGERYGSEERGRKVAGAILKRIRAKHMKEENLNELSAFGSAFAAARKSGQSNFSFGGKSFTTQMKGQTGGAKPAATKPTPSSGMSASTAAARTSGGSLPSMASTATPSRVPSAAEKSTASNIVQDKGPSMTRQYSFPGSTVAPPKADIDTKTPKAPSSAADVSGADKMKAMSNLKPDLPTTPGSTSISAQPAPTGGAAEGQKKMNAMNSLKESVQVGENKYRIV